MSSRVGVLKAPTSVSFSVTLKRPTSSNSFFPAFQPTPTLWYWRSVSSRPSWQLVQAALPLKIVEPRADVLQAGPAVLAGGAHVAARPGGFGLGLERSTAPVPVELGMVADVPQRGAGARQLHLVGADGLGLAVGQAVLLQVAGIAGAGAIAAQPRVVEELL